MRRAGLLCFEAGGDGVEWEEVVPWFNSYLFSGVGDVQVPVLIWTSAVWYIVLQFSGKATKWSCDEAVHELRIKD